MSAEEIAQHRQEYWEALSSGLDNCRYGLPFTEEEKREVFSHIKDSEIIENACEHADVSPGGSTANTKKICRGYGYEVVYTVRGDKVCNGYGYNVAYTIRGNQICDGYGYSVAYTIRDDKVCNGYGYNVAYTIRGNQVCQGYGYTVAYTIR